MLSLGIRSLIYSFMLYLLIYKPEVSAKNMFGKDVDWSACTASLLGPERLRSGHDLQNGGERLANWIISYSQEEVGEAITCCH